jgi:hypothetical protein
MGPLLLHQFVVFMDKDSAFDIRMGYVLCLLLFGSRAVQSFADHQYAFKAKILGLHLRTALQTAVYAKVSFHPLDVK